MRARTQPLLTLIARCTPFFLLSSFPFPSVFRFDFSLDFA